MTAIPFVALSRTGPKFDPRRQERVARAVAANKGVMIGVVHPLACAKERPITGDHWLDRLIPPGAYLAYLGKLADHLRTAGRPILVFLEADKRAEVEQWLISEAITSPAESSSVIILETRCDDPLPQFDPAKLGTDVNYHGADRPKYWEFLSKVLADLGVGSFLLTGEKYLLQGRKRTGCVMAACEGLNRAGSSAEILSELTFPNLIINEINAGGSR